MIKIENAYRIHLEDFVKGFPFVSYIEECPICDTVNVIVRLGIVSTIDSVSEEEPFVCSHCGWYEDIFIQEYAERHK